MQRGELKWVGSGLWARMARDRSDSQECMQRYCTHAKRNYGRGIVEDGGFAGVKLREKTQRAVAFHRF